MENKGLLKLPETWHIVITEENRKTVFDWFKKYYPYQTMEFKYVGFELSDQMPTQSNRTSKFGQEITFADFKRLVLGEKNVDDYGVMGNSNLWNYLSKNKLINGNGCGMDFIYFIDNGKWTYINSNSLNQNRQSLLLEEYLKLIEPEIMEKKYEYKLRDQSHKDCVNKLIKLDSYDGDIVETNSLIFRALSELNVLDLFFEKIEVKELPIIGGTALPIISEDGDLIEIAGFQMDMYIIDHFKSFTLGNDFHVSESDVKQIREYLNK